MKRPPVIVVQIIHILGPSKGEIQEFIEPVISVGRHASCHVRFPVELTSISRKHAEIVREGNQFKLVDHSTNGTYVNGKKVTDAFLKNGDVLEFSGGGPKVSFLTQIKEVPMEEPARPARERPHEEAPPPVIQERQESAVVHRETVRPDIKPVEPKRPAPPPQPGFERQEEISPQLVAIPLVIQYGPTLRSFKALPVTLGKGGKCNFVIDHPAIFEQHAQIFFSQNEYWIMDLTGQRCIQVNGQTVALKARLKPNDELALSPSGPYFRYLGEGRIVEMEKPVEDPMAGEEPSEKTPVTKDTKKPSSVFKKFFSK
jgi:pSer/pThr/pTyr-binding forkhead associated (FHA) protein